MKCPNCNNQNYEQTTIGILIGKDIKNICRCSCGFKWPLLFNQMIDEAEEVIRWFAKGEEIQEKSIRIAIKAYSSQYPDSSKELLNHISYKAREWLKKWSDE